MSRGTEVAAVRTLAAISVALGVLREKSTISCYANHLTALRDAAHWLDGRKGLKQESFQEVLGTKRGQSRGL